MSKGILLSGGFDSVALMYWQRPDHAISIDYGQKPAAAEISASSHITKQLGIHHVIISVDCSALGSGDLVNSSAIKIAPSQEWWPFRNQLLITLGCMKGVSLDIDELLIGSVKSDGFHVDGSKAFFENITRATEIQEGNIKVTCPAIELTTEQLIKASRIPDEILFWAHSCHTSNYPCGNCRGCQKHLSVLQNLGHEEA